MMVGLNEIKGYPQSGKPTSTERRNQLTPNRARIGLPTHTPLFVLSPPDPTFGFKVGSMFFRRSTAAASPKPTAQPKPISSSSRTGSGRPSKEAAERNCSSTIASSSSFKSNSSTQIPPPLLKQKIKNTEHIFQRRRRGPSGPRPRDAVEDPPVDEDENRAFRSGFRMGSLELVLVWSGDRGRGGRTRSKEEAVDAERSANESRRGLDRRQEVAQRVCSPR